MAKGTRTLWLKTIAPSQKLRESFSHGPAHWAEFGCRYRAELAHNETPVAQLLALLRNGRVTLLYGARDPLHNHALVLADYLRARFGRGA
jgi:uncharacterized protein YeaO (DUF488 family)